MKWLRLTIPLALLIILLAIIKDDAGSFLVFNELPRRADVIIVIDGGASEELGIKYFHLGYAPCILFTRATDTIREQAIAEGVPTGRMILEDRADSTYENAAYSKTIMQQRGFKSALVVALNYHSRRTMLNFLKVFKNTGTDFTFSAAADPGFNPTSWWTSGSNIRHILREYCGIASFYLGMGPSVTDTMINRSPLLSFIFNS
jgi:uncharacterized SAM-binding protein YcdF (DUF218 family)